MNQFICWKSIWSLMEPDRVKMGLKSFSKCKNSSPQELSFVIAWLGFNEAENQSLKPWQEPLFGLLCLLHLKKYSWTLFDMGWQDCKDEEILFPVEEIKLSHSKSILRNPNKLNWPKEFGLTLTQFSDNLYEPFLHSKNLYSRRNVIWSNSRY